MRRMAWVLVALVALGLLASAQAPVKITFWTHEDPNRTPLEQKYIAGFQAMFPHVTIERVTYASGKMAE